MIKFELNSCYDGDYVSNNELTKWFLFCCSYVLASYAHFLWDADEEDEVEEESEKSFGFFNGVVPQHPPSLAAAS
jgi:hypothetical protein